MVKAYVLIVTDPGRTRSVTRALIELPHVRAVSEVMGPYDIVVELIADSLTEIPPILADRIRTLEGIQSTTSLVAFPGDTLTPDGTSQG
jgi:DNA-binding Lrp family transcriptional regulator